MPTIPGTDLRLPTNVPTTTTSGSTQAAPTSTGDALRVIEPPPTTDRGGGSPRLIEPPWGPYCPWNEDFAYLGPIPEFLVRTPEREAAIRQAWYEQMGKPRELTQSDKQRQWELKRKSLRVQWEQAREKERLRELLQKRRRTP